MTNFKLLVTDFDNTLYDWVTYFVTSLKEMIDEALPILGVDREILLNDLRTVHQKYSDSEHPFALLETQAVIARFPDMSRKQHAKELDRAFYAFNRARKTTLVLYPGVIDTLSFLRANGIRVVGHTEAKYLSVVDRINRLNIQTYFNRVYCRERSFSSSPHEYHLNSEFNREMIVELSQHRSKPSAEVLLEICEREGHSPEETVYIGDSLIKDIFMANNAGTYSAWAKYGLSSNTDAYEQLVRISHWREEDIEREREIKVGAGIIEPDLTLEYGFFELRGLFKQIKTSR